MASLSAFVYREKLIESRHTAICLVKDIFNKVILSTNNDNQLIYPRSAIKIFQALPFINSNAHIQFDLSEENIAISCSSHSGELQHIHVLNEWVNKIDIEIHQIKCGIHNPLNEKSSTNLLLSGNTPTQLHNNCAGKHLGMISGCLANKMDYKNYINFKHPYQKLIRDSLEYFVESKIQSKCIGVDGCNAPQYAFNLSSIATSMVNLVKEKTSKKRYSNALNTILSSINKFPILIGGSKSFDSDVIKITKGRVFSKEGAEGVLLFADFLKKVGGVIKILDGNKRAIPSIAMELFQNLELLSEDEKKSLSYWATQKIFNYSKKEIGKIVAELK